MTASGRFDPALLGAAGDFVHFSWPQGVSGLSDQGTHRFRVAAPRYLADFDVNTGVFTRLFPWEVPDESEAFDRALAAGGGSAVETQLRLDTPGGVYTAFGRANPAAGVHLIESGKYVTWVNLTDLDFRDGQGNPMGQARPHLELVFWADRVYVVGRVSCERPLQIVRLTLSLSWPKDAAARPVRSEDGAAAALPAQHVGVLIGTAPASRGGLVAEGDRSRVEAVLYDAADHAGEWLLLMPGEMLESTLVLIPHADAAALRDLLAAERHPPKITLSCPTASGPAPAATFDPLRGWHSLPVPPMTDDYRQVLDARHVLRVAIQNPGPLQRRVRLRCAMEYRCPVIGTCPMLCDAAGRPVGLPVQISKNWHGIVYVHGHAVVTPPPKSRANFQFVFAFEQWGGKPAATHAQLNLVGWDSEPRQRQPGEIRTQVWQEMALGVRGENICYDPDICQGRSFVDDMRALRSTDMAGGQWGFASNVGGADFLVYWPTAEAPLWPWPVGAVTQWRKYGPNLTETVYQFASVDGKIRGRVQARSYASDDMARAIYNLRYDVVDDLQYARLALFTLGADRYNGNVNRRAAQGDASGVSQEWTLDPPKGEGYWKQGMPCLPGAWFALYDEIHSPTDPGGNGGANRALLVRSYQAVLDGRPSPAPQAAFRLNSNAGEPSVILELQPAASGRLRKGDFIEAQVEMLIYPKGAQFYHGPDAALHRLLEAHGDSWQPAWAAAQPLSVKASAGTLLEERPARVRVDGGERAELTLSGPALGWTPVSIEGFRDYRDVVVETKVNGRWRRVDQSVRGNDFWQMAFEPHDETFSYILCLPPSEGPVSLRASRR